MSVRLAVSPTNPTPGIHLTVSLIGGAGNPGIQGMRVLIVTPRETGQGDIVNDTEVRPVFSEDDVRTAAGRCLGYFAYRSLTANDKEAQVDVVACTPSGGAVATQTITFGSTPTAHIVDELDLMGHLLEIEWPVGATATEAAADAVSRINDISDKLYFTAANVAGVVTLTARGPGPAGNDCKLAIKRKQGAGGTITLGGAALAGGTTEVDMTNAFAAAAVQEYDYVILCCSNTDAQSASASSNPARLRTHIDNLKTGTNAKLQQGISAATGTRAQSMTATEALNHTNLQHANFQNSRDLPCEVAAAEVGDRMQRRRLSSNANRVRQPIRGLRGARDWRANIPSDTQFTAAANAGVTVYSYDAQGQPIVIRPITTYHADGSGNQDRRCFDVNEVDSVYDLTKDLRVALPAEFQGPNNQVLVMRDRVEGDDELPENTVEERDIKAFIEARIRGFWIPKGVIQGPAFEEAVVDGSFVVEVNDTDETQVDIVLPVKVVKILAKLGLYVQKEN